MRFKLTTDYQEEIMTQTIDQTALEAFLGKVIDETGAAYNTGAGRNR